MVMPTYLGAQNKTGKCVMKVYSTFEISLVLHLPLYEPFANFVIQWEYIMYQK